MSSSEAKRLVKGAFVLTLAGVVSKILSAGYRIPLQNITGDIGFYIYQQVYPLLGMAMVLALYGLPSAVSKLVADRKAGGYTLTIAGFYGPIFSILLMINGLCFLLLYVNAHALAQWVGNVELTGTYQIAAFVFLLIPFSALLRGVFQGNQEMKPTAYSQVGEQILRVFIIIFSAVFLAGSKMRMYRIGEAAGVASISGAILAILILSVFFIRREKPSWGESFSIPWKTYIKTIFLFGMVAALNHMILLVIQLADAMTLVRGLMEYGLTKQGAMEGKGIFDRGQPLIQLGTVLGSSFALSFIPSLSKQSIQRDRGTSYPSIQTAVAISFYLAAGATIGLIMILPETNLLLYQDTSGTKTLMILALAIFLSAMVITATSILQGIGYMKRTAGMILVAFALKWLANTVLVPVWGIAGSATATVLSLSALGLVVLIELKRKLPQLVFFKHMNWLAFFKASMGMIIYLLIIGYFVPAPAASRLGLFVWVIVTAMTGALVYIILLLRGRAFTKEELAMLPFADLFISLHKGRKT